MAATHGVIRIFRRTPEFVTEVQDEKLFKLKSIIWKHKKGSAGVVWKMDHRGRRNRRRNHSRHEIINHPIRNSKPWSYLSGLYSFIIMSTLLALIYLMLEHHCKTCTTKCDLSNITKNIEDISKNLSVMKDSYYDLETKMVKFSQDLPKIEGQIDILEAIANTIDNKDIEWKPKIFALPTVEVARNHRPDDDTCNFTARHVRNTLKPIIANAA